MRCRALTGALEFAPADLPVHMVEESSSGIYIGVITCYTNRMSTVKTAVSIEETLFRRAEKAAEALEISRSGLIALALESYLARYEADQITAKLNEVYANGPDEEDLMWLEAARVAYIEILDEEEW
jgi:hypothetical protein